jgi:hypothetical protein
MEAKHFCCITLDWDYAAEHVKSMPGYVEKTLQRFTHPEPIRPQHAPHPWSTPNYGTSIQFAEPEDTFTTLGQHGNKRLQEVIGTFLFDGRAVDNNMLAVLGILTTADIWYRKDHSRSGPAPRLCSGSPRSQGRYTKSDMILYVHSDVS